MKKTLSLIAAIAGIYCFAGSVFSPENINIDGCVRPFSAGEELFYQRFDAKGTAGVEKKCFLKNVRFGTETIHGKEVLTVRWLEGVKKKDTAWHIRTKMLPVPKDGKKVGIVTSSCARSSRKHMTGGEDWRNNVLWYGKDGKILCISPFRHPIDDGGFALTQYLFPVPAGAVSFQVQLGSDDPNMKSGEFYAYEFLKVFAAGNQFAENASFVTKAFPVTSGKVIMKGKFPKGTEVRFRVSSAPDDNGIPGTWSAFSEKQYKNGDALPAFAASAKWIRLQILLKTGGTAAPVLEKLYVGPYTDGNWNNSGDSRPPIVTNLTEVSENLKKPLRVQVCDENEIRWNTMTFTVDDRDVTQEVVRNGNILTWQTKVPYEKRHHSFKVTVSDILGNTNHAVRHFDFVPVPKKDVSTLRDDGMVLVDGKPFFPIGIFSVRKHAVNGNNFDNAFRMLKEGGFTLGHSYIQKRDKLFEEFLTSAGRQGIRLFVCNTGRKSRPQHIEYARKEKAYPGIVSWYIADDTVDHYTKEYLEEKEDALRSVAPGQLSSLCEGSRDYAGFSNCSDIYLLTSYSVRELNSGSTCIGQVIYDMKEAKEIIAREGNRNIAIWPVIQYFKGWVGWKRYPTPAELRGMTYAAIIYGGKGMVYYTYMPGRDGNPKNQGAASSPEAWKTMTGVTKELHSLLPVLEERDAKVQPSFKVLSGPVMDNMGNASLSGLGKFHKGKYYLFTVNSTDKTVKGTITVKGMKSGTVLFENGRNLVLKDGSFTDEFALHGVHVYVLEEK